MLINFTAYIKKFEKQGEKTGWTYIEIPASEAHKLNPGVKTSYRVKGSLDTIEIEQIALLPMGGGDFIMPLNLSLRKKIGKKQGYSVQVKLHVDTANYKFSDDFITCLEDEPKAMQYYNSLPLSHQKYFSKWIETAKTIETKRITMCVKALSQKQGFAEMLRANKK